MNLHAILQLLTSAILPAIWVAAGPLATTAITAFTNSVIGKYVPRSIQVILSGALGAVVAGLTGEAQGVDPGMASSIGMAMGLGGQTLAATHPDTLLTSAPKPVIPLPPVPVASPVTLPPAA